MTRRIGCDAMREALKSAIGAAWATSLFAVDQLMRRSEPGSRDETDHGASGRLDLRCMVAIGGGLAAGSGEFALSEDSQRCSFVAQASAQMETPFLIPLLQAPGIYGAPGFPEQPVILPQLLQTTVVGEFPSRRRYNNVAVPGFELADCVHRRPVPPLVQRGDVRQTLANLILGLPTLTTEPRAARQTQLEYAVKMCPSLVVVEIGYSEALRLALRRDGDPVAVEPWGSIYARIVAALRDIGAEVMVATVPDPTDTGGCLELDDAARVLNVAVSDLQRTHRLGDGDRLTIAGLTRAAFHALGGAARLEALD